MSLLLIKFMDIGKRSIDVRMMGEILIMNFFRLMECVDIQKRIVEVDQSIKFVRSD